MIRLKKLQLCQAEIVISKTLYVASELHIIFSTELFHLLQFGGIFNKQLFTAKQLFRFVFLSSMKRGRLFKTCRLVYYRPLSLLDFLPQDDAADQRFRPYSKGCGKYF